MEDPRVQTLRGAACLLLVLYHVVGATPAQGLELEAGVLRTVSDALAILRMPLFALLAGALHGWRPRSGWPLVAGKARRLLVPMLVVGTAFAVVQAAMPGTHQQVPDWRLLHWVPVAHFWFLESLFLIFLACAIAERVLPLATPAGAACVLAATVAGSLLLPSTFVLGIAGALYLAPFFMLGMVVARHPPRLPPGSPAARAIAALMLAGAAACIPWLDLGPEVTRTTPLWLWAGALASLGAWLWAPRNRWLAALGAQSYAVFLFHIFFTAATRLALDQLGVESLAVQLVAGVSLGVAGPVLVARAVRRIPLLGMLMLGDGPRRAAASPLRVATGTEGGVQ